MRADDQFVVERVCRRKYSHVKVEPPPVDEFDAEPVTKPIPHETLAALVYGADPAVRQ